MSTTLTCRNKENLVLKELSMQLKHDRVYPDSKKNLNLQSYFLTIITVTWANKASVYTQVYLEAAAQSPPRVVERLKAETLTSDEPSAIWQQVLVPR